MHWKFRAAGMAVMAASVCLGQNSDRQKLIQQVEAADALAKLVEHEAQDVKPGPMLAQPGDRLAYDQVLKAAMEGLSRDTTGNEPADLAGLNTYQLRQAVSLLHLHNVEVYMQLNAKPVKADAQDVFGSAEAVQGELARSRATTQPTRSAVLMKYLMPPKILERITMDNVDAAGHRQDGDSPQSMQMTPEQLLTAIMSGQQVNRAFGVPSTIAPTDARMPGSKQLNEVSPRTLPFANDVPGSVALRADPPGNSSAVVPKPEEISRLVSALGVTPDVAEQLATGRMTLSEALAGKAKSDSADGGLTPNDPRWQTFYFGPTQGIRDWSAAADDSESFTFQPGGGRYVRSDQRVNNDRDTRMNGQRDRRVNINADRRTTIQLDPRVTNVP